MTISPDSDRGLALLSWLTAALLLILPFAHTVALRHVLTALVLLATALQFRRLAHMPRAVQLALLCWLGFTLASVLWSVAPVRTIEAWLDEAFYPAIVFCALYAAAIYSKAQFRLQVSVVVGLAALGTLSAFGHHAILVDTIRPGLLYYYPGVGQASSYAVFALPVLAIVLRAGRWRWMGAIGLLACVVIGSTSLNRMFWPTAVFTLLCAIGFQYRSRMQKMLFGALALTLAIVAIGFVYEMRNALLDSREADVSLSVQSVQEMLTSDPRREIWRAFSHAVLDAPWLGMGFGKKVPHEYYKTQYSGNPILAGEKGWQHAHNLFLNIALQVGVVGVVILLWLLLALTWSFAVRRHNAPVAAWAGLALLLALVLKNMTDDFMRDAMAMYFWALAGWLLALSQRDPVSDQPGCSH